MALVIELPQVGESVVEGTIGKWLKQPGDTIQRYDPLVEVVTDKVTMDMPSPVTGTLLRILAQEGDVVPMGAPIAEVETDDAPPAAAASPQESVADAAPAAPSAPASPGTTGYLIRDQRPVGPTGGGPGGQPPGSEVPVEDAAPAPAQPAPGGEPLAPAQAGGSEGKGEPARLSPAVRRLAREHNVDLSQVTGTGMGGRITRQDVEAYIEKRTAAPAAPAEAAPTPAAAFSPRVEPAPGEGTRERGGEPSASVPSGGGQDEERIPLTPVRRMIAEAMVRSVTQIPHAWSTVEVDVTRLVAVRGGLRESFQQREGVEITYLPFVIKMVVEALRENPTLNASWGEDAIILKKRINMGIAVAGPEGLIVPVIHDAQQLSIAGLAHRVADLTSRARSRRLTLDDVQGGTFTLNNTGVLGSTVSQPIINPSQAAILTTEAIQKRPVVVSDSTNGDAIAVRSMMNVCLSFDHRINDGAESSAFLQSVKRRLEAIDADTPIY